MSTEAPLNSELEEALKKALEIYRQSLQALKEARAAYIAIYSKPQKEIKRQKWQQQVKQFQEDRKKALEVLRAATLKRYPKPAPVYELITPRQDYALYNLQEANRKYAEYNIIHHPEQFAFCVEKEWTEANLRYFDEIYQIVRDIEAREKEFAEAFSLEPVQLSEQGNGSREDIVSTPQGAFKIVRKYWEDEIEELGYIREMRWSFLEYETGNPAAVPGEEERERLLEGRLEGLEGVMRYYLSPLEEVKEEEPESRKEAGKKEGKRMQVPYTEEELARVEEASKQEEQTAIHFIKRSSLSMAALMDFYGVSLEEVLQAAEERLKQPQKQPPSA